MFKVFIRVPKSTASWTSVSDIGLLQVWIVPGGSFVGSSHPLQLVHAIPDLALHVSELLDLDIKGVELLLEDLQLLLLGIHVAVPGINDLGYLG